MSAVHVCSGICAHMDAIPPDIGNVEWLAQDLFQLSCLLTYSAIKQTHVLHIQQICVEVNFLCQVIFIFLLFELHQHTLSYPKTKENQTLPEITKLTTTYKFLRLAIGDGCRSALNLFKIKIVDFFTLFKTNHFVSPTGLGTSHNLSWRVEGWRRNWGAFNFFLMEYGGP